MTADLPDPGRPAPPAPAGADPADAQPDGPGAHRAEPDGALPDGALPDGALPDGAPTEATAPAEPAAPPPSAPPVAPLVAPPVEPAPARPPHRTRVLLACAAVVLLLTGLATWTLWPTSGDHPDDRAAPSATPSAPGPGGTAPQPGESGGPSDAMGSGSPVPSGSASPTPAKGWWRPTPGLAWQWQLKGPVDRSVDVPVYDIDAVESSAADVAALHAAGRKVICYVNAGAYEDWRPDKGSFPAEVLGAELDGWPGERWLDVRRWDILGPLMGARFEACRSKGFDAVEPDNVDGYANASGFPLSAQDQLAYNRRLADLAHGKGLAIGLKNDVEQAAALEPHFDFAVNEECMAFDECGELRPFIAAGKPVFHVEYADGSFCPEAKGYGFSSMRKKTELDAWREPC